MSNNIALVFSKDPHTADPLEAVKEKRPVYDELFERCAREGLDLSVVTRKNYQSQGLFLNYWRYKGKNQLQNINEPLKVDLAYDRSGGLMFPPQGDSLRVVDNREFKLLAWDKWLAYKKIGKYSAQSYLITNREELRKCLGKISTEFVVIKPTNGLKGRDIFIGPKDKALDFIFQENTRYIAQDFVNTEAGIPGIVKGRHDMRVAIINSKAVWSHVRTPPEGSLKANVAGGGTLTEVSLSQIPQEVMKIVNKITPVFYKEYDNPVYSLDFGYDVSGKPFIFEINDQIGFPKADMKAKDRFLSELVINFKSKL